jgi:hypothetical protein
MSPTDCPRLRNWSETKMFHGCPILQQKWKQQEYNTIQYKMSTNCLATTRYRQWSPQISRKLKGGLPWHTYSKVLYASHTCSASMFIYSTHKSYSVEAKHAADIKLHKDKIAFNFISFNTHYIKEIFKYTLHILKATCRQSAATC